MRPPRQPRAEAGFTLVEMLVALALLSMVGLAMARFQLVQLGGARLLGEAAAADIVVENATVDLLLSPTAPPAGTATIRVVNAGREWQLARSVAPLGDGGTARVDLSVALDGRVRARRTLLLPAAKATP